MCDCSCIVCPSCSVSLLAYSRLVRLAPSNSSRSAGVNSTTLSPRLSTYQGTTSTILLQSFLLYISSLWLCLSVHLCVSVCLCPYVSVCLSVPSNLHLFHMYGTDVLSTCPGAHGGGLYIKKYLKFSRGGNRCKQCNLEQ